MTDNETRPGTDSIEGFVDDLGRPATAFTPPEVRRRDPSRWPTPQEFVDEWEQRTPEARLALAERILGDAQMASQCFIHDHVGQIEMLTRGQR